MSEQPVDKIEVELKVSVDKEGKTKFTGIVIAVKNEYGTVEQIDIQRKESVLHLIGELENLTCALKKTIGIKEEEKKLEDLINLVMGEEEQVVGKRSTFSFTTNKIWCCRDTMPKCLGCEGCGGLPGSAANYMINGQKIQAIKILREATSMGLKDAKEKVEEWYREVELRAQRGNDYEE